MTSFGVSGSLFKIFIISTVIIFAGSFPSLLLAETFEFQNAAEEEQVSDLPGSYGKE